MPKQNYIEFLCAGKKGWQASEPNRLARISANWKTDIEMLDSGTPPEYPAPVFCVDSCSSSLDVGWDLMRLGRMTPWTCVLAGSQDAGRGQMRRFWVSIPGNILGAVALPSLSASFDPLASLLCGYALVKALKKIGCNALLKWPNDIYVCNEEGFCKAGGLLVEERNGRCLLGVGLNIVHAPSLASMREDCIAPAGVLNQSGASLGPLYYFSEIYNNFISFFESCLALPVAEFIRLVEAEMAFMGRRVAMIDGSERVEGVFIGLDFKGQMRLNTSAGEQTLYSGSMIIV